ncbi:MAG: hypothetical protein WD737_05755 [Gemmatimonadota bacterium]
MSRAFWLIIAPLVLCLVASPLEAQDWQPPSREMPTMPEMDELASNWLGPRARWFAGVASVSGVEPSQLNAVGQGLSGTSRAQVVHFNDGPIPVVVWQDRNGDSRADIIEIYRSGGVIIQTIDADYDGQANVVRVYDASGTLLREDRL